MKGLSLAGLLVVFAPLLQSQEAVWSEPPAEVSELIAKLPECSRLRGQLERGQFEKNVGKPYMRAMLDHGLQRAFFEIQGNWRHDRAEDLRITRRLYYRQLDGPEGPITDSGTLEKVKSSGLEAMLDKAVVERSRNARRSRAIDGFPPVLMIEYLGWRLKGSTISGSVELFATPLLNESNTVGPGKLRHGIANSAYLGDVIDLSERLGRGQHSQLELSQALIWAVNSRWDNTAAIELLIKAGADVNSRISDETTPLMLAVNTPCNIPVLLAHGARATDHDKWGRTASDLAGQRHGLEAARRLLENARPLQ